MIAYLLKKFPRLSETFILNELLGLEQHGLEFVVLSRRVPDDEPRHPELARLRTRVELLPNMRQIDPWTSLFGGDMADGLLDRVRVAVQGFGAMGHPRFPSLLGEAVHVHRRCAELGIHHVHAHFATDAAVVAHLAHALGGPTYSLTLHAKDIYRESTVIPAILTRLVAGSEFSVTVCDANVQHLKALVGDPASQRVRRLYNGIDLEAHAPGSVARDPAHVLGVGRLVEKKGFDVLVEAMGRLAQDGSPARATIVGQGEGQAALEALIERLGLADRVHLAGPLDQGDVRALMARATVLASPCLIGADGNRDALPTVLLEAQAAGLPVVSTPVTGIPEILDDGRAGLLVPQRDPDALAAALDRLLGDAAERAELARAGRARAEQLFDIERNSAVLFEWLSSVGAPAVPAAAAGSP